jgi:hypothetical protein
MSLDLELASSRRRGGRKDHVHRLFAGKYGRLGLGIFGFIRQGE